METLVVFFLNGLSYGLLLFMLSSGLTLIFSMMGVLNFAHASFYMLGAYFAYELTGLIGFTAALVIAPLLVGLLGAAFERYSLRKVHAHGHVPQLLITFGLSYVIEQLVRLYWGSSTVDYRVPEALSGTLFTLASVKGQGLSLMAGAADPVLCAAGTGNSCTQFPLYRGFMALVALFMLGSLWLLLTRTRIGLIIQAALTHPDMAQALGHNVPRVMMGVFGGGCALAGLAGVIGGNAFVTEPHMAASVGAIIFVVVVVGGMGSLAGAFLASLWLLLTRTRVGLIIQAALTHPDMAQALGHNVPRVMMGVFGGGCALAGLAGVIGGNAFVTEPNMAASVGAIIFVVVVVGGMGSLAGAFLASLLIGMIQTFAVVFDGSLISLMKYLGQQPDYDSWAFPLLKITVSQMAPILPYLLLVLMLIFRPKGLLGTREE